MTIHVNIGEAKTRLSELIAAALRGEEVWLAKAGLPQVRLMPADEQIEANLRKLAERRASAFDMFAVPDGHEPPLVRTLKMNDAEIEEHYRRKFGSAD